ncbi:glycoside hydrolase superfamily [Pavlovales sp. CCMP2436]|nr:glycoside hydrolase superfamily [Pavlovales sp. CCMP2436]
MSRAEPPRARTAARGGGACRGTAARLLAVAVATLGGLMVSDGHAHPPSDSLMPVIDGRTIMVGGKAFYVRGVCYSPVPINESMLFGPYGDYFTDEYAFLWRRDLPLIRAMGANAIRIYGWDDASSHQLFLDYVQSQELRVLITYPLGSASNTPVRGDMNRQLVVDRFAKQVHKYGEHPAILAWSFGNEINMMEHGFLQEFDREFVCGWNVADEKHGGCYNPASPPNETNPCMDSSYCVYDKLFRWINKAAAAAHEGSAVPVLSTFADTDLVLDKIGRAGWVAPSVDLWAVQLYRGSSFGPWFAQAANASNTPGNHKPFLVTEYGVDAYHDVCGHDEKIGPHCDRHSDEYRDLRALTGDDEYLDSMCVSAGGFVYGWVDELFKNDK